MVPRALPRPSRHALHFTSSPPSSRPIHTLLLPNHAHAHCTCSEVYLDGMVHGLPTGLSVALCFFVCPGGLLLHAATRTWLLHKRKQRGRH